MSHPIRLPVTVLTARRGSWGKALRSEPVTRETGREAVSILPREGKPPVFLPAPGANRKDRSKSSVEDPRRCSAVSPPFDTCSCRYVPRWTGGGGPCHASALRHMKAPLIYRPGGAGPVHADRTNEAPGSPEAPGRAQLQAKSTRTGVTLLPSMSTKTHPERDSLQGLSGDVRALLRDATVFIHRSLVLRSPWPLIASPRGNPTQNAASLMRITDKQLTSFHQSCWDLRHSRQIHSSSRLDVKSLSLSQNCIKFNMLYCRDKDAWQCVKKSSRSENKE